MDCASFTTRPSCESSRLLQLGCLLCALGCAGSQTRTEQPSQPATAPGQVQMHDPNAVVSTSSLGTLEPVHTPALQPESPKPPSAAAAQATAPIHVAAQTPPRPYALRDGNLVLPTGLIIHRVPKGVSVRVVQEQGGGDVWEVVDARARRIALLKAESLTIGAVPQGALLSQTANARSVGQRSDWGAASVKVVTDRFLNENHLYTIERRAEGTAWIWSGLELSSRPSETGRAE
jgi:hypothetical protein